MFSFCLMFLFLMANTYRPVIKIDNVWSFELPNSDRSCVCHRAHDGLVPIANIYRPAGTGNS